MNNKYKFLISNTGLFFISTFSSKFLVFLLMPIYTAVLTPGEYNSVDIMTQTANLLIPLVSLGISNSIIRFGLDKQYSKRGVFTTSALTLTFGFAILLACYPILVRIELVQNYILYLYLYLFMSCTRTLVQQFARAKTYTRLYAVDGILATVNTLVLVYILLMKLRLGAIGYILATIGADFLSIIFLSVVSGCWKCFDLSKVNKKLTKEMLGYCLPLIPASIFWWITNVSDRYLVTYMVSESVSGIYAISYKIPSIIMLFATIFTEAWQISAVKESGTLKTDAFFKTVFKAYQSVVFMAGAGLILICRPLISFMVDEKYYTAWTFIPVLILATIFSCFSGFMSSIYMVEKKGTANLLTMMAGAFSNIGMNIILIPKYGAQGAAIATFISYFLVFVLRAVSTKKYINVSISPLFMGANLFFTMALAYVMVNEVTHWLIISVIFTAVIFGFNFMPLFQFALSIFRSLTKKRK
ncbi:MAG: polysaccharide biosynthesis C-terminal domain-containing protein [Oscillospiraceae bacterium]